MAAAHSWRRRRGAAYHASRAVRPPTASIRSMSGARALVAAIDAALTKEARKADALRKEAKAAADAEAMAHRANLIFSNLYRIEDGATQISVEDWENGGEVVEITLSPKFRSAKDEADAGFKKARRLRRGSAVVEELLEASSAKSTVLEGLRGDAVDADGDALEMLEKRAAKKGATVVVVEAVPKTPVEKKKKSTWTGRTFTSPAGVPILVGRSRKENDRLSHSSSRATATTGCTLEMRRARTFYATLAGAALLQRAGARLPADGRGSGRVLFGPEERSARGRDVHVPEARDEAAARAAGRGPPARGARDACGPTRPGARRVQGEARGVWAGG